VHFEKARTRQSTRSIRVRIGRAQGKTGGLLGEIGGIGGAGLTSTAHCLLELEASLGLGELVEQGSSQFQQVLECLLLAPMYSSE
jgi:hypothetical protein